MSPSDQILCSVRYSIERAKFDDFRRYAQAWVQLIEKYGGSHVGYYESVPSPTGQISFPGLGTDAPMDVVVALFSFPSLAAYEEYRRLVRTDALCAAAERIIEETGCVLSYERMFLAPIEKLSWNPAG